MKKTSLFLATLLLSTAVFAVQITDGASSAKNTPRVITLEQAYDITLASDQSIRIAWYEIRKANLLPWSAVAKLGPQLTGNASSSGDRSSSTTMSSNAYGATDTQSGGLTYTQPLFDPSVFPAYRYGRLSSKAAKLQYQFTVRQTLFGVAQAYYNALKQQKLVAVNQQTVDLANEQLKTAKARFDAGAVARIDVLRARATLEDAHNTLIQSQGVLDTARDTLSNILNLGGKTDFILSEPPVESDLGTPFDDLLKTAYDNREDFKVSSIAVDQQIALKGEVVAEYGPKIVAQASTQWNHNTGDSTGRTYDKSAVISVQMPFLTGGQREIDLITANHQISEARLNLEKSTKSVESDIKTAWISVQTGREALKALTAEVEASTQNYTDSQAQYQAGTATSLDAQTALRDLNNARTLLTNQIYDYQIALRNLKRAEAAFQRERVEQSKVK